MFLKVANGGKAKAKIPHLRLLLSGQFVLLKGTKKYNNRNIV